MGQLADDSAEIQRINGALAEWRQRDLALEERWFTHIGDPSKSLTPESGQAEGDVQAIASDVEGLHVVTHSCDIVRSCVGRAFLEESPLVKVDASTLLEVQKGQRPVYAFVPAIANLNLVADLDRVMTVEKAVAATWKRTPGCRTDAEARDFAQALARKRERFAFPDDFTDFARKLQSRLQEKHDRQSEEGKALRVLREIRVRAAPSWDAPNVELTFWFIRGGNERDFDGKGWHSLLENWLKLIPPMGRYQHVDGLVVSLEDLTAKDYTESDPLDLDHLSGRE